jgi:hypothetical protein
VDFLVILTALEAGRAFFPERDLHWVGSQDRHRERESQ